MANSAATGLKNGSSTVNADNYTISEDGDTLTIKKTYLETLAVGEKTFKVITDDAEDNLTVAVTVTDTTP